MYCRRVILCSGTLGRTSFVSKAEAASAVGFDGISIYLNEYEPGVERMLDDLGLTVAEVDGVVSWLPNQGGFDVGKALDTAAVLGARSLTAIDVSGTSREPASLAAAFADLCDRAAAYGLGVHLEAFPWSGIPTVTAAHDIVKAAARSNGGILLDTWHLVRGADAGRLDPAAVPSIVAVQAADPAPTSPGATLRDECMTDRRFPGPTAAAIIADLPPDLPLEVEVFGLTGPPREIAAQALRCLRAVERARPSRS